MVDQSKKPEQPPKPPPTEVGIELAALSECVAALQKIDKEAQQRVLSYVKARFGIYLGRDD